MARRLHFLVGTVESNLVNCLASILTVKLKFQKFRILSSFQFLFSIFHIYFDVCYIDFSTFYIIFLTADAKSTPSYFSGLPFLGIIFEHILEHINVPLSGL